MTDEIVRNIRSQVYERMDLGQELSDSKVWELVDEQVMAAEGIFDISEKKRIGLEVFNSLRRLDVLQELVDDSGVSEIMINGPNDIFIERKGEVYRWDKCFSSREKLEDIIQLIVGRTNRMVNEMNPIVDTRLENGSRVNIVLSPVAINGPIVTIRRFPDNPFTMDDLLAGGSLSGEVALFLKEMVENGMNIFVSGGTSSGKTTFLNVLANYIPENERVITIEDSAELCLKNIKNLVRLETRNKNSEGNAAITIRDLIKSALRMRP
ncbi:MAG: Flp pilus assembly complex ATPase component TadA, partial [Eubacterium sp.]|nr:Flp pilus assembly complex ATPase component TadA [Eubacterium sp.]